jgi:hypothetical protein
MCGRQKYTLVSLPTRTIHSKTARFISLFDSGQSFGNGNHAMGWEEGGGREGERKRTRTRAHVCERKKTKVKPWKKKRE